MNGKKKIIDDVLKDLYNSDYTLKSQEKDIKKVILEFISMKPDIPNEKEFKLKLKQKLLKEFPLNTYENKMIHKGKHGIRKFLLPRFSFMIGAIIFVLLATTVLVQFVAKSKAPFSKESILKSTTNNEVIVQKKFDFNNKMVQKSDEKGFLQQQPSALPKVLPVDTFNYGLSPSIELNTEEYLKIYENDFLPSISNPLSTFSIDVDTASYSNVRRFINDGMMPYKDAVRIEEMINYFDYDYPEPQGTEPFSLYTELSICPWNPSNELLLIGLQSKKLDISLLPRNNLVFLIDVSGSMNEENKLPLVIKSLLLLVDNIREKDQIAIVVYAGSAGLVLPSTKGTNKKAIKNAILQLQAGGSTAGGEGIELAYKIASDNFIKNGNNRIILVTDGDFNVGPSSEGELLNLIEKKRNKGIYLTILGFGTGNYKDSKMEQLADKGNGNYAYIDSLMEAHKILVNEMNATLLTIAKDVKIQVEFNPALVKQYRLIGYENRVMKKEDFEDDTKDAGEIGLGHSVTVLYELIPEEGMPVSSGTKYQTVTLNENSKSNELMNLKIRYKKPDSNSSIESIIPVIKKLIELKNSSNNFRFATAVAEFGLLLRDSKYKANGNYQQVLDLAKNAMGDDTYGYRAEFISLVHKLQLILKSQK